MLAVAFPALGLSAERLQALGVGLHQEVRAARLDPERWRVFTVDQRELLTAFVDEILPATDTPSASEAGVVEFCDVLVAEWFPQPARAAFLTKLEEFAQTVVAEQGQPFQRLETAARVEILSALEDQAFAQRDGGRMSTSPANLHEQHLFDLVKWMTIFGFYTSEAGMKQERGYRVVPGRYRPDVPYDGIG